MSGMHTAQISLTFFVYRRQIARAAYFWRDTWTTSMSGEAADIVECMSEDKSDGTEDNIGRYPGRYLTIL